MPLLVALGTLLVLGYLLWFALGTQRNISRGNDLLRWLQSGLRGLGKRTTVKWLGSSAVQLQIVDPEPPFEGAQVNVVLEPRDIGWLWAWARQRGRRDFLILRGTLPAPPRFDFEAGGAERGWTGADKLRRLDPSAWERASWDDETGAVEVAHSDKVDDDDLAELHALWQRLAASADEVWRISVRNLAPHVEVHVRPPDLAGTDASTLIDTFRDLGRLAART